MPNKFYDLIRDEFLEPAGLINKELSCGCLFSYNGGEILQFASRDKGSRFVWLVTSTLRIHQEWDIIFDKKYKILGHPYDLREVALWVYRNSSEPICIIKDAFNNIDLSTPLIEQDLEGLYNFMKSL